MSRRFAIRKTMIVTTCECPPQFCTHPDQVRETPAWYVEDRQAGVQSGVVMDHDVAIAVKARMEADAQ